MKFKQRLLTIVLAGTMGLSLVGCGSSSNDTTTTTQTTTEATTQTTTQATTQTTTSSASSSSDNSTENSAFITVNAKNGEGEFVDMQVPFKPEKVAFLDYVALDMCIALGLIDDMEFITVQGDGSMPEYLMEVFKDQEVNLGGLKSYQEDTTIMTEILEFEPNLIFTSGRSASDYESFMEIVDEDGGVVSSSITYVPSTYDSFKEINTRNASIFGLEDEMDEILAQYDDRLEELKSWGEGQTAMMTIFTGGSMNVLGNESRCSMIFNDLGFENVGTDVDTSHGDTASYEALLALNPDYIFVLDRDSAIGAEGATAALELLDNEIVHQSDAWQNGNVVILDPLVWYLVEGGVIAMDTMLSDLEAGRDQ
ncbi:MAG: ABC transporter substrate-binding protein [bacterium]